MPDKYANSVDVPDIENYENGFSGVGLNETVTDKRPQRSVFFDLLSNEYNPLVFDNSMCHGAPLTSVLHPLCGILLYTY
jgi:hypothetical protein